MSDSGRPISWVTLEKGTPVLSSDGEEVGTVAEVIADRQKDIFSGITISSGMLSSNRFAPAAIVETISVTGVHLSVSAAEVENLNE